MLMPVVSILLTTFLPMGWLSCVYANVTTTATLAVALVAVQNLEESKILRLT